MNTNPIIQSMMIFEQSPEVIDFKGKAITTSLAVSAFFGKRHKNVLQAIENLDCSPEFSGLNFQPAKYKDEQGKMRPMYRMTRDGFTFLAMGFRGKKAATYKEAYITRFNDMEDWIKTRHNLSDHQSQLGDAIQYRERIAGKAEPHIYARENNLIYCVAIGNTRKKWLKENGFPLDDDILQHLSQEQLKLVDFLVVENATMIKLGMDYHDRKAQLERSALYHWQTQK